MQNMANKPNKTRVNITIPPDLHVRASRYATTNDISFSALVQRALKRVIREQKAMD